MNTEMLINWLEIYQRAWEGRDPDLAGSIFSENAIYQETPFNEPFSGRDAIIKYWTGVPKTQDQIQFNFDILAVTEITGVVHWQSSFIRLTSRKQVDLDGIMTISLNDDGLCTEFKEWWHRRESV